jgi:hypothetical protein
VPLAPGPVLGVVVVVLVVPPPAGGGDCPECPAPLPFPRCLPLPGAGFGAAAGIVTVVTGGLLTVLGEGCRAVGARFAGAGRGATTVRTRDGARVLDGGAVRDVVAVGAASVRGPAVDLWIFATQWCRCRGMRTVTDTAVVLEALDDPGWGPRTVPGAASGEPAPPGEAMAKMSAESAATSTAGIASFALRSSQPPLVG